MIAPADRISSVSEYYFSVKLKEIAAMNAEGANVINLGIGSPDLPPSAATVDALTDCARRPDTHGYQPYVGIPQLRAGFADFYRKWYGVELDPAKEVLPLMGSKEGIMHISMAFVNPGDGVLVPNPGYPTYSSVSKLVGAEMITYSLDADHEWHPDFADLEARHERGEINLDAVKLMWCNYPNMPTGANGSEELFRDLVDFGKRHDIIICHDNPYSFVLNEHPISILAVPGAKDICIELNSMSKSFNMPGWRIGMLASNPRFVEWILRVKSNMDSGMFKGLQLAAVEALKADKAWFDGMNDVYSRRRDLARRILRAVGTEPREDQVGLFLWAKVQDTSAAKDGISSGQAICDRVLYDAKVFLTPGFIFGSNGNDYVRISLCANEETLAEALERIENLNK